MLRQGKWHVLSRARGSLGGGMVVSAAGVVAAVSVAALVTGTAPAAMASSATAVASPKYWVAPTSTST